MCAFPYKKHGSLIYKFKGKWKENNDVRGVLKAIKKWNDFYLRVD